MGIQRDAPDKVKLKLRADGTPFEETVPAFEAKSGPKDVAPGQVRDEDGRAYVDWSGAGGAGFGHPDPATVRAVVEAATAALSDLDPDSHRRLADLTARLADGLAEMTLPQCWSGIRSVPGLVLPQATGADGYRQLRDGLRQRGIWVPAGPGDPWVVTLGHDRAVIDRTVMAVGDLSGSVG